MAEPQKGGSSPVKSKTKTSMLDDVDFGKDFLTSWKPMSMGDDNMDFDFQPSAKGKKKAFDFDKMDMDFSLDGDLDKISSFKVDFFDLDISSPSKKGGKLEEKAKDKPSGGNDKQKQDSLNLPFEFNDMGNFSPKSSLQKEVKQVGKNNENKEASNRGEGQSSETDPTVGIGASEDVVSLKVASLGGVSTSNTKTSLGSLPNVDLINKNLSSHSEIKLSGTSESAAVQVASEDLGTRPETTRTTGVEEIDQDIQHQQNNMSSQKVYAQETAQNPLSVSEKESTRYSNLELQVDVSLTDVNSDTNREQNATSKPVGGPQLSPENVMLENSTAQHTQRPVTNDRERTEVLNEHNIPSGSTVGNEPAQGNPKSVDNSIMIISRDSGKEPLANKDKQIAKTGPRLSALSSGTSVGTVNGIKEKENAGIQSRFFKKSSTKESQSDQRSSDKTKVTMVLGNTISSRQRTDERRKETEAQDAEVRSKLIKISGLQPVQTGRVQTVQGLKSVGSSEQPNTPTTQNSATPTLRCSVSSAVDSSSTRDEVNKVCAMEADKSSFGLSCLKTSGSAGVNQHSEKTTFPKQISSLLNRMQIKEPQGSAALQVARSVSMESHPSRTPFLKRKLDGASKPYMLNLSPLKRLSPSPRESRVSRELPDRTIDKEDCTGKKFADDTDILQKDCQRMDVNMTEAHIPLVMPNDDTVEKAEAYAKELEDICNMLKKKHEEAKELLVRAVVNNSNMLMLNHPIHEEKIRKIQKFAAQLMSRELLA